MPVDGHSLCPRVHFQCVVLLLPRTLQMSPSYCRGTEAQDSDLLRVERLLLLPQSCTNTWGPSHALLLGLSVLSPEVACSVTWRTACFAPVGAENAQFVLLPLLVSHVPFLCLGSVSKWELRFCFQTDLKGYPRPAVLVLSGDGRGP